MASLPHVMKGILVETTGGTEVLQYRTDLPVPSPKHGEVLVKNSVVGVNFIDTYFRTGLYQSPKPEILGKEGAGKVVQLGAGVTSLADDDTVVYSAANGGYAEFSTVSTDKVAKIPQGVSEPDACAALIQGLTALTLVEEAHKVKKGDWVMVLAASGGVGGWLCQVLRAIGAHTIATVGSAGKVQVAEAAGAEVVLVEADLGDEGIKKTVNELTEGEGVSAVFDGVGKATFDRSLDLIARKGTVVSFGNASGAVEPFKIARLAAKNAKVVRPTLFNYIYTREEFETYADRLWSYMLEHKFSTKIHRKYPLQEVAQAHKDLEGRKTTGKLLLVP